MTEDTISATNQESELIYEPLIDYTSPIYDPFATPKNDDFKPYSKETNQLLHLYYIMRDIQLLYDIISKLKNNQQKRLLVKYMIIELVSVDEHLRKFANLLIAKKTDLICSEIEIEQLKNLKKAYEQARKPHQKVLDNIRNKLAAHRDELHLEEIATLWQSINLDDLVDILNAAVHFFNFAKDLQEIYSWYKVQDTSQGEMITFFQPGTGIEFKDKSE